MSLLSKNIESTPVSLKQYIIPMYIAISVVLLMYFIYNWILGGVYNVALSNGAQQGYQTAITQLIEQASKKECQPVAINLGESKVEVINVACLPKELFAPQQAPVTQEAAPQQAPVSAE